MVAQIDRTFVRVAPGRAVSRIVGYSFFEGRPVSTAGRWWNPIVFGNLRLAAGRAGRQVDGPIFIVGMGRSGTTLLGRILAAHPNVGFLNEPKAMWHVIRDDEDIIGSYAPPDTGRLYLSADDASEEVSQRSHALFAWYLRATHSKQIVDKYPELIFRHRFVRAIFPDARFLIAVRSPWSTLHSVARWSESHATNNTDWWGVGGQKWNILWTQGVLEKESNSDLAPLELADETDNHIRAAVEWTVTMREAIALAALDPLARVIHYEELIRQPQEMVRKILHFCGLPGSSRTEAYAGAIISTRGSERSKRISRSPDEVASRLPDKLTRAIDATWSHLNAIGPTSSVIGP